MLQGTGYPNVARVDAAAFMVSTQIHSQIQRLEKKHHGSTSGRNNWRVCWCFINYVHCCHTTIGRRRDSLQTRRHLSSQPSFISGAFVVYWLRFNSMISTALEGLRLRHTKQG